MSTDDTTLDLLRDLLTAQPDNHKARAHLAALLLQRGEAAKALRCLDEAPTPPDDLPSALLRGKVLEALDATRATEHYLTVLDLDRRAAPVHLALARLYRQRGLREEARQHYGIAVVLDETLEDVEFDDWIHGTPRASSAPVPPRPGSGASGEPGEATAAGPDLEPPTPEELEEQLHLDGEGPLVRERITFDDVGGMEDVKEQVRMRVVYPFRNPELFQRFKKRPGGGILLYGPPGCGKTHIARATAGECDARFVSIGVADVLSRWLGESEQRLVEIFAAARRRAPTILFVDELDALGMSRRDARGSGIQTVINQLLTEMDGIGSANANVLVLGATNAPWNVDTAFRRPGRFDRVIFVPPPDAEARRAILELHLSGLPHGPLDRHKLAQKTKMFSGADLKDVVERAGEAAIQLEMRTGRAGQITQAMLLAAIRSMRPSTVEWMDTAKSYASYANRAGQYDDVARFFESGGTD